MSKISPAKLLQQTVRKLMAQRANFQAIIDKTQAKIDEIDSIFAGSGLSVAGGSMGRAIPKAKKAGKPAGGRRSRRTFAMTGDESVIAFVKKHGNPSAKEVNENWAKEGRGGSANNALTKLVKNGTLKRVEAEDARGGRYVIA